MSIPTDRAVSEATAPPVEVVEVSGRTECHVTPSKIAGTMFYYLELEEGHTFLEPQGGTGNIVDAMADRGHDCENITTVEQQVSLCEAMKQRFSAKQKEFPGMAYDKIEIINDCFLDWAANTDRTFDRVAMNPPFKTTKKHVQAAFDLLAPGGVLVALVPVTFKHDEAIELEKLGPDTFASAKVYTKIIRLEK